MHVSCAKAAEPVLMPFGIDSSGPGEPCVGWWPDPPQGKEQFWGPCDAAFADFVGSRVNILPTMKSCAWLRRADWTTSGLLLMLLLWQRISVGEAGCASEVCFCFEDGDIECADIYLRRVPRFTRSPNLCLAAVTNQCIGLSALSAFKR